MEVKRIPGQIEALKAALPGLAKAESRVGWFAAAKYPDGTPVAGVMAVQEFGSAARGIPPRPTMRPTAEAKGAAWVGIAAGAARAALAGTVAPGGAVEAVAMSAAADVRRAIIDLKEPPLSMLTLLARKHRKETGRKIAGGRELGALSKGGTPDVSGVSTKPLNDTGYALATLTYEVSA